MGDLMKLNFRKVVEELCNGKLQPTQRRDTHKGENCSHDGEKELRFHSLVATIRLDMTVKFFLCNLTIKKFLWFEAIYEIVASETLSFT